MWTRKACAQVSENLNDNYKKALAQYESALVQYEIDRKEDPTSEKPEKPLKNKFIIAGNISSAALITTLSANKYYGLVFESEADTLSNTLNNKEWGGFNDIIRRAFHNESISYSRKKDDEDIEITKSYLSMVLSGTPQQISRLVSSVENGFFSRILFYDFPNKNVWKNVFEKQEENLEKYFEAYASKLDNLLAPFFYNKSKALEDMILFEFTPVQEDRFNSWFQVKQTDLSQIYGDDIIASVRRLAVCFYRIAMILSVLRLIESHNEDPYMYSRATTIPCADIDYENAEAIIEVLIFHTIKIFRQVKKTNRNKYSKGKKVLLLENLPVEFDRAKAMDLAAYIGIKEKTAENYLSQFISQGMLSRVEHNHYKKVA